MLKLEESLEITLILEPKRVNSQIAYVPLVGRIASGKLDILADRFMIFLTACTKRIV